MIFPLKIKILQKAQDLESKKKFGKIKKWLILSCLEMALKIKDMPVIEKILKQLTPEEKKKRMR